MDQIAYYESDFGTVKFNTGVKIFDHSPLKKPVGNRKCKVKCIPCRYKTEETLNRLLEAVWVSGGLVTDIYLHDDGEASR